MSNILTVTVPISVNLIREYFKTKETTFLLDYHNSRIHNLPFLTYVGNSGLPADILISDEVTEEKRFELLLNYMQIKTLCPLGTLNRTLAEVMLTAVGIENVSYEGSFLTKEQIKRFIRANRELVDTWTTFLHSCMLYLIYTVVELDEVIDVKANHKNITDPNIIGLNVAHLFGLEDFYLTFISGTMPEELFFYTEQFDEPMFRGAKLLKYFHNEANEFYPILLGLINKQLPFNPLESADSDIAYRVETGEQDNG